MSETAVPRRAFLRGVSAATALSYSRVWGANERVQVGLIGCGERGRHDMGTFIKTDTVTVGALCDIWNDNVDRAKKAANNSTIKTYTDHRKLLELKDLDVVLIGVPDHWHAQIALDALNAGKDVYVEKPLTLKIEEGPPIVKAARVNNRICQVGMQQRSGSALPAGQARSTSTPASWARSRWRAPGGTATATTCGKAPARRCSRSLPNWTGRTSWGRSSGATTIRSSTWNWRAYLDFGGGQVTDLFTHWIDVVHMFMGKEIPSSASGLRAASTYYKDGRTAPDTINVLLEYPSEFTATFEATLVPGHHAARPHRTSAAPRGACGSTAAASNSIPWGTRRPAHHREGSVART